MAPVSWKSLLRPPTKWHLSPQQVKALIEENERLHADARRAADLLEGRAMAAAASMVASRGGEAERARLQVGGALAGVGRCQRGAAALLCLPSRCAHLAPSPGLPRVQGSTTAIFSHLWLSPQPSAVHSQHFSCRRRSASRC
jgi:hypothetical protein